MTGPLHGVRVLEIAGIGPGPFCGMLLADLGAEVIRVDRAGGSLSRDPRSEIAARGRRRIAIDLKRPGAAGVILRLVEQTDVLIEGFRPGVTERLGIGPDACLERNPKLVYGRMTGWGQHGPLATTAGHDIDYIAVAGALHPIRPADRPPPPPLNMVGDFGGGGMLLALGVLSALLASRASGTGQVVDAAMVDGTALLTSMFHGLRAIGEWTDGRESNVLDGAAPFYGTYRCADGRYIAVGAVEPKFTARFLDGLGIPADDPVREDWYSREAWPQLRRRTAELIAGRTRDEWCAVFAGTDACVAPVLSLNEAPEHPHTKERGTFRTIDGVVHPAPAPRFSATPLAEPSEPRPPGADTDEVLASHGFTLTEIGMLRGSSVVA